MRFYCTKSVLNYIITSLNTQGDTEILIKALLDELPTEWEDTLMTLGEQLFAKGEAQGFHKGELQGEAQGFHKTVEALNLIHEGADNKTIQERTQLSLDNIQQLRKKILVH